MADGAALRTEDIGTVHDQFFTLHDFRLANGAVLPEAKIVYETYGRLAPPEGPNGGRNAVLITHGYTGSHHAAGRNPANGNQPGSWDGLIGPGKAVDTDKLFVVASNMLGSSFGSTNAASLNPATGEPYGPDFPAIGIRDIVAAQKALLDLLGVSTGGGRRPVLWRLPGVSPPSPIPNSSMGSCRSTPRPGRRSIPTAAGGVRRGSPPTRNGMAGAITAKAAPRPCDRDPGRDIEALWHRGEFDAALSRSGRARGGDPPARRQLARNWTPIR